MSMKWEEHCEKREQKFSDVVNINKPYQYDGDDRCYAMPARCPCRVYVAGPMTGLPGFNFPAFDSLRDHLRKLGYVVSSPADHDRECYPGMEKTYGYLHGDIDAFKKETGFDFHKAIAWDFGRIMEADMVVFLPGWEKSTGANHERYVAEVCGKRIVLAKQVKGEWYLSDDLEQVRVSVLS